MSRNTYHWDRVGQILEMNTEEVNQFALGILLVFLNRCTGLFLAKNPNKFLAINNFFCQ